MGVIITKSEEKVVEVSSHETLSVQVNESLVNLEECKKIENDAYHKVMKMYKEDVPIEKVSETLVEIMGSGAIEFKQKTGREMTYSEMREMYG
jgi:hypothetical protein